MKRAVKWRCIRDGENLFFQAERFGGRWLLKKKIGKEGIWQISASPNANAEARSDFESLLETLKRRYVRKRSPWECVTEIQSVLDDPKFEEKYLQAAHFKAENLTRLMKNAPIKVKKD